MSERADMSVLRVVRGQPTDADLAGLITALAGCAAAARASAAEAAPETSSWGTPAVRLRRPVHPGPGGWRRSAMPG
jgi:hypothetical protein